MLIDYFKFRKISLLISGILFSSGSLYANVISLTNNEIEKFESDININSTSSDAFLFQLLFEKSFLSSTIFSKFN